MTTGDIHKLADKEAENLMRFIKDLNTLDNAQSKIFTKLLSMAYISGYTECLSDYNKKLK